jgi:hypothetical protein
MSTITVRPWNGDPPYTALTWNDIQVAIQSGDDILVDGTLGKIISVSGGYLLNGCPLPVYFGTPLNLAQAQVLVGMGSMLAGSPCLAQAQALVATSKPAGSTPPSTVQVSNAPAGPVSSVFDNTPQPSPGQYSAAATATALAPSQPAGLPTGTGSAVGGQMLTIPYRFILQVSGGYATGANLPGCSQTNSASCDPQFFPDPGGLLAAIQYALSQGQTPYQVLTSSDPWALMAGTLAINPAQIYNADGSLGSSGFSIAGIPWWAIAAAGAAAYFLTR